MTTSVFLDQMIAVDDPVSYMIDEMALFTSTYNLFTNNTFVQNIFCQNLFGDGVPNSGISGNYSIFQNNVFPTQSNAVTCSLSNTTGLSNLNSISSIPQGIGCKNNFVDIMKPYFAASSTSQYIAVQGTNIYLTTNGVSATGADHISAATTSNASFNYPSAAFSISNNNANYLHDTYVLKIMTDVVSSHYSCMCANDPTLKPLTFTLQNKGSTDSIGSWLQDLCLGVFMNVYPTDTVNSFSIYYQAILKQYDTLKPAPNNLPIFRNIFAVLMFPYFIYKYIIQNIGELQATSSQKAPRIFILRRYAIGCAYLFEYFLNKFNLLSDTSSRNQAPIIAIMVSINANQVAEDSSGYLTDIVSLRQETLQNNTNANNIAGLNMSVIQARNNLQKAITNDIKVIPQVKYSIVYLVISIVMFCIILIICPILIYFAKPETKVMKYMYSFCAVNLIWLSISGLIQVIRTM